MKKIFSGLLVLSLLGSGLCLAADQETASQATTNVSLDSIEEIWTANSQDLTKYQSTLTVSKSTYEDLVDDTEDMIDLAMEGYYSTYNTLRNSRDEAEMGYEIAQLQYEQKIQTALLEAKKAFLTCWQDELSVESTQESLTQKQSQLNGYATLLQQGYISQNQYDNLKQSVDNIQDTLDGLAIQQETDLITLKVKLGLDTSGTVVLTYPELTADDMEQLMKIDYSSDLETFMANSVDLKILQITYDKKKEYHFSTKIERQDAALDLEMAKTSLPDSFKITYNSLMSQYSDLKTSYTSLSNQKDSLDQTQTQFALGVGTSMDYVDAGLSYVSAQAQVQEKEISLYSTYLTYLNAVAGN